MMHPLLRLVVFVVFLAMTGSALATGQVLSKWGLFTREDNPIQYWLRVLAKVGVLLIMPLYCLPDWLVLIRRALRALS